MQCNVTFSLSLSTTEAVPLYFRSTHTSQQHSRIQPVAYCHTQTTSPTKVSLWYNSSVTHCTNDTSRSVSTRLCGNKACLPRQEVLRRERSLSYRESPTSCQVSEMHLLLKCTRLARVNQKRRSSVHLLLSLMKWSLLITYQEKHTRLVHSSCLWWLCYSLAIDLSRYSQYQWSKQADENRCALFLILHSYP